MSKEDSKTYNAYPTIVEFMKEHNITIEDLANRCMMAEYHMREILENDAKLTTVEAMMVEAVTGLSAENLLHLDLVGLRKALADMPEFFHPRRYDFVKGESDESNQ